MDDAFLTRVSIRPMTTGDLGAIVEIDRKVIGKLRPDYWNNIITQNPVYPLSSLVAEYEGSVIGFVVGEVSGWEFGVPDTTGWLTIIGVDPDVPAQGRGKKIESGVCQKFESDWRQRHLPGQFQRFNTTGSGTESAATYEGDSSTIRGLRLKGEQSTFDETKSGIWLRARAIIQNCAIDGFSGHGVYIAAGSDGNPYLGNVNLFYVSSTRSQYNLGSGFHVEGTDANSGNVIACNATHNTLWGYYEDSFLGNAYYGCHCSDNTVGPYYADNNSPLIGCYSEGDLTDGSKVGSIVLGGLHAAGTGSVGFSRTQVGVSSVGTGPYLVTEYANGPRGLWNKNGGFQASGKTASNTTTTQLGMEDDVILAFFNSTNSTVAHRLLLSSNGDVTFRHASSSEIYTITGPNTANYTFGRSVTVPNAMLLRTLSVGFNNDARRITYLSAAPSTGAWGRGDVVFNNAPYAEGNQTAAEHVFPV